MKNVVVILLAVTLGLLAGLPAYAQSKPIQLALLDPVQVFPNKESIGGLRISVLYGKNVDVTGLDLAFIAAHTTGKMVGVQSALVGMSDGGGAGIQYNFVTLDKGKFTGIDLGFYNSQEHMVGLQWGFINTADKMTGLQLGLVNIIHHGGLLPFFVVFNVGMSGN